MAGFAVVMTILTFGFLCLFAACVASIGLYLLAKRRLHEDRPNRRRVIVATALAPFLALFWLIAALLIHVEISNRWAHQDCGFSPDPFVTLPNGYVLGSANTYDGYFRAPGFQTDAPVAGPGYVRSIIDLQLSNGYFTGTQFDFETSRIRHFVFDTRTRAFQAADQEDSARSAAAETNAHTDATSYWKLYAQYRHHWPNYILMIMIITGESAIGLGVWKLWTTE